MEFILKFWLYLAFGLSGALLCFIIKDRQSLSRNKFLSILVVAALPFHMFEERIWPAGFSYIYGLMTEMEQTQLVMLSCNVTVLTVLTIFLPNLIFNGSAYPFPNAGFYEQFIG